MTLNELLEELKQYKDSIDTNDDCNVIITLDEPSVGARAGTALASVSLGFDWEHGQLRLQAADKICRLGRTKNDIMPMNNFKYIYDTRTVIKPHCPKCETQLNKTDFFCRCCGQRVNYDNNIVYTYDCRKKGK